jgi:D-alanyl-D-alanine carboxypeptidase (penicillin-binding protein 5/6)
MGNPVFARMVGIVRGEIATEDGGSKFRLENKNELVGRYRGAAGVKTGFTRRAGKCLVAFAERDGRRVLLVLLNAPDRWWKAEEMLDAAFALPSGGKALRGP